MSNKKEVKLNDLKPKVDKEMNAQMVMKNINIQKIYPLSSETYVKINHPVLNKIIFVSGNELFILNSLIEKMNELPKEFNELLPKMHDFVIFLKRIDAFNSIEHEYHIDFKNDSICIL